MKSGGLSSIAYWRYLVPDISPCSSDEQLGLHHPREMHFHASQPAVRLGDAHTGTLLIKNGPS